MFSLHSKLQLRLNEEAGLDNLAQSTCSAFRNTLTSEQDMLLALYFHKYMFQTYKLRQKIIYNISIT